MQVQLVMFKSDGSRRDFPLMRDRIIIGRTNEVGLRIPLSSVSRKHCEIVIDGDVVRLRDLGSSNGTLHNSVRVKEAVLAAGDRVEVGPVVFVVVIDGVPAEVEKVCSLVEQELVDTGVGMAAVGSGHIDSGSAAVAKVMEPGPVVPAATPAAAAAADDDDDSSVLGNSDEVLAEIDEPEAAMPAPVVKPTPKPVSTSTQSQKPKPPAAAPVEPMPAAEVDEEDALAAAARAAEMAKKPGESFSGNATELDMEDPIAALERLAAAERAQEDHFAAFMDEKTKSPKPKK